MTYFFQKAMLFHDLRTDVGLSKSRSYGFLFHVKIPFLFVKPCFHAFNFLTKLALFRPHRLPVFQGQSFKILTITRRVLGPSNSAKKICCQVPRTKRPFFKARVFP